MLTFYISMLETEEQQDKFSYIYQNYAGFMYHVAKEVVKEHYLAEDVVHETFLQLIRIIDKVHIDDELTLRAFLRRVTHNKAVDCVRKWDKVRPTEDDELERYDTKHKQDPETIAIDALAFNELIAMISKMDDRYRQHFDIASKINLSCILTGFTLTDEETSNQDRYIAEFTSDSGGWYTVRVVDIGSEQEVGIDNELTRYYELEFDGNHAIWGIREDNSNVLVWEADGLSFTIYGNPNISELIKVAEGITVDSTLK